MLNFNNRELAIIVWITIVLIFLFVSPKAKEIRKCFKSVLTQAFIKKFNIIYALMLSYIALVIINFSKIGLWDLTQSKTTVYWVVLSAIPTIFKTNSFKEGNITFRGLVFDNFKLAVVLEVIVSAYIFGIIFELIMIPFLLVIGMLIAFCENNKTQEYRLVHKFLNTLMGIIAFSLILHAFYGLYTDPEVLLTKQTIFDFLLPIALTITFIPFLYGLMVYSIYETIFISINSFIKDCSLNKKTKFRAILLFNFRTKLLERWQKYALCKNIASYDEVESSFKEILRINRNEKKENKVLIKDGWSPKAAREFLVEENLKAGYYNPPQYPEYDKTWFACSNILQIDGSPSNNISYHIDGCEDIVKNLKLFMNVNNKEKATDAHDKFLKIANLLYKKAVCNALSKNTQKALLSETKSWKEEHDSFIISVGKDKWEIGTGYSASFSINNKEDYKK